MDLSCLSIADVLVVLAGIATMIAIGLFCSKKNRSVDDYFMAGRKMPGLVVGISIVATMVSSIGFLAVPAFAYEHNWRYLAQWISFIGPMFVALFVMIPFFRSTKVSTAYEYLELRYSTWVRLYVAFLLVVGRTFYLGTIVYMIAQPIQLVTSWPIAGIIVVVGLLVALYTVVGGLEAVIWTDLLQGVILFVGALVTLPIICHVLPGGLDRILSQAYQQGKMSLGTMAFSFQEKGFWVMYLNGILIYLLFYCTDQTSIQRYCAARSLRDARKSLIFGACCYLPLMFYFLLIGTSLYVFYQDVPDEGIAGIKPDQIFPYFVLTRMPAGLKGLIIVGVLAAATSTLDSVINANASILTNDFYKRVFVRNRSDKHYYASGKLFSVLVSLVMIGYGIYLSMNRTGAILDILMVISIVSTAGLVSIFMLGFITTRVGVKSIFLSLCVCVPLVLVWLFLKSERAAEWFPDASARLPDIFWIGATAEALLVSLAYLSSYLPGWRSEKDLQGLTVWTKRSFSVSSG